MKGVQFLADERGTTTGVLLDLRQHRRRWEDIYDTWIAEQRKGSVISKAFTPLIFGQ